MVDAIPPSHLINVLEVVGLALVDTVRELDHVQRREDITAKNFMAVLSSKVLRLDSEAKRLGVDVKFVSVFVAALQDEVSSPLGHPPKVKANLRLVSSRPDDDHR